MKEKWWLYYLVNFSYIKLKFVIRIFWRHYSKPVPCKNKKEGLFLVFVSYYKMNVFFQALAVLRRTQLVPIGDEVPILYIPASDAVVFRTSMLTRNQYLHLLNESRIQNLKYRLCYERGQFNSNLKHLATFWIGSDEITVFKVKELTVNFYVLVFCEILLDILWRKK